MGMEIPPKPIPPMNNNKSYTLENNCMGCGANSYKNGECTFCKRKHPSIIATHVKINSFTRNGI